MIDRPARLPAAALALLVLLVAPVARAQVESREGIALQNQILELRRDLQALQQGRGGPAPVAGGPYQLAPPPPGAQRRTHARALFDHCFCTVHSAPPARRLPSWPAQMSPISPFASSYQPWPGIGSVIASQSSWELVEVKASS